MPMGKVFHIAPGHWAGHMRIYHRQCLSLARAGYAVELAARPLSGEELSPLIQLHSLGDYGRPTLSWRLIERIHRCQRAYRLALRSKASLFQFYSPEFICWGARLRRTTKCPVVFDCMEDFEGYVRQRRGIPNVLRRPLVRIVRQQLRYAARNVDALIVADEGTARMLRPYAQRLVVLHNFPQLSLFQDPGIDGLAKPFDLVYHGSIPKYHLEVCLAVDEVLLARGREVTWYLIGRLPERDWFNRELYRRSAGERFHVSELIPHDRVAQEVVKAKIGIIPLPDLPKFQNNIPQKMFEYMALRMPIVMSDLPPSRPFVGDGACAFMVPPDDPTAYADAIIRLLDTPALSRQMGAEGRRRVEQEYNWEKESHKLLNLYAELLDR